MPVPPHVDPVIVEVVGNYFRAVADEMGIVLIRSAYSTNIVVLRLAILDRRVHA